MLISACSLVTDFPHKLPTRDTEKDAAVDELDAQLPPEPMAETRRDARVEPASDARLDARDGCLGDARCGQAVVECVVGSGKGCDPGAVCADEGGLRRCVACVEDDDCAAVEGKPFCEGNACVQCRRGAMLASAADDVGCGLDVRAPICGPDNTCVGCDDSMEDRRCPGSLVCSPGLGCGGCNADAPDLGANGCSTPSAPGCRQVNGLTQCQPCTANQDCRFAEGKGYCVVQTGTCSTRCDPAAPPANNGCTSPSAAFCKAASSVPGGVDCAPCSAGDCSAGSFCATSGQRAGTCVGCRADEDCAPNPSAPLCDLASQQCRARTMNDCKAPTPYLSSAGTCVACTQDRHCSASAPTCNAMTNLCEARCISDARCRDAHPDTRRCNRAMTACVQCNASTECPVLATPLCSAGSCVPCTDYPGMPGAQNAACSAKTARARCFRSGSNAGLCGQCDPTDDVIDCTDGSCNASLLVCE
ncbi:MAG TPA: hypothetical protein VFX59_28170 [Polyangiales bacterium]|nr:hypothetical protein [Polyangiales bacterium]